jgi:hypothetical protein
MLSQLSNTNTEFFLTESFSDEVTFYCIQMCLRFIDTEIVCAYSAEPCPSLSHAAHRWAVNSFAKY